MLRDGRNKLSRSKLLRRGQDLRIGGIRFAVSGAAAERLRITNPLYFPFVAGPAGIDKNPRIAIRWRLGSLPRLKPQEKIFDTERSWSMYRDANDFWIRLAPQQQAEPLLIARFNPRLRGATIFSEPPPAGGKRKIALSHPVCLPLDQLLLMHFLARRRGVLAHAAGIVKGGRAMIFPGSSGAGKSTFSQLLAEARVGKLLSDERMIVREIEGVMQAFGTPWAGTAGIARNGQAPLAGIYFLKHGAGNQIKKLAAADALDKFLPLISIPWYDPDTMSRIITFAKHLVAKVPVYEMGFKPDRSAVDFFWQFQKSAS